MSINGIGTNSYQTMGYGTGKTTKKTNSNNFAGQLNGTSTAKISSEITLHWFDNEEGDKPVGAVGTPNGGSMTAYKPKDFDESNPVYKVKIWDEAGNVTERTVDISQVDPTSCDEIDMFAYSSYLTDSGKCSNAQSAFMGARADYNSSNDYYNGSPDKTNWLDVVKQIMQMQYDAGNLEGYLDYKKFWDYLEQNA
jgi:hypothetical protein